MERWFFCFLKAIYQTITITSWLLNSDLLQEFQNILGMPFWEQQSVVMGQHLFDVFLLLKFGRWIVHMLLGKNLLFTWIEKTSLSLSIDFESQDEKLKANFKI